MTDTHHPCKLVVLLPHQTLRQDVGYLVSSRDVLKSNLFFIDFLPKEMVVYFNVFGVIMEFRVSCDGDSGLVVHV